MLVFKECKTTNGHTLVIENVIIFTFLTLEVQYKTNNLSTSK